MQARESVFYLAYLASTLQSRDRGYKNDFPSNRDFSRAKSQTPTGRTFSHLATLLNRGKVNEVDRVVAVTGGLFHPSGIVCVMTSPATSPVQSPTISPSSSGHGLTTSDAKGSQNIPVNLNNECETNIILGRNSADKNGVLSTQQFVSDEKVACDAALSLSSTALKDLSFFEYTIASIRVLRGSAAIIRQNKDRKLEAVEAAQMFFVTACRNKILDRLKHIQTAYGLWTKLGAWEPQASDPLLKSSMALRHPLMIQLFARFGLTVVVPGDLQINNSNAVIVFRIIVECLELLQTSLKSRDIPGFVGVANALVTLLAGIPLALWSVPSLVDHLKTLYFFNTTYPATEEDEDSTSVGNVDISKASPVCLLFYQSIQAVCAWNTGARYLIGSTIAQHQIPIHLSLLDLPREPVDVHSAQELLDRWTPRADWEKSVLEQLKNEVESLDLPQAVSKGAVHCEAGLVAALYYQQQDRTDLDVTEPAIVTDAFASLSEATQKLSEKPHFAIGVAKKWCPMCKMLIDILPDNDTSFKIEYGGNHTRYHPWAPPHWLPTSVLEKLEEVLLQVVGEMVASGNHLQLSRAPSPSSIRSRMDWLDTTATVEASRALLAQSSNP
ncbi:hypothetical protein GGX14DRAFT_449913 [Mycena pura]|uniref:Uncharacterized protein n=1 Tax=Mycena pura TaxID=153505 RepID=A0AAD6YDY1_9AGAR|nr:hypothetical protein GGX14DRAFT_449913 [Mycena pura]